MSSFGEFLADPFGSSDDVGLSTWRLFLVVGLIIVLIAAWGLIFRSIAYGLEKV